ncbi:MAG: SDR family oxidoreductase [Sandaracinaceae bacterium]|nr:SDR family oxidoreductase [Sandaracinaceae bacterium]
MQNTFSNRVAFLTGAASGIGLALSRQLAARGARVTMSDRDTATVTREARAIGARAVGLDVTDRAGVHRAIEATVEAEGRLDYLFSNAGIGVGGEARDFSPADWDRVIDVNLGGVVNGVLAAYPIMARQRSGHIVNVASVAGLVPLPGEISYTTSKWAVVGLSRALRAEAADLGVKVTVVCPGTVATPIYATSPIVGFDRDAVLAMWPRGMAPDACARELLEGVAKNRAEVVITGHARALRALERLSPRLVDALSLRYFRRVRRFRTEAPRG